MAKTRSWRVGCPGVVIQSSRGSRSTAALGPIPRIVHQVFGLWDEDSALPARFERDSRSWREGRPGWSYRLWRRKDVEALVSVQPAPIRSAYAQLTRGSQRADLARYLILHQHGGLYADLDVVCINDLDPLLSAHAASNAVFFVERVLSVEAARGVARREPIRRGASELRTRIANFVMASTPGSSVIARIVDLTLQRIQLPIANDYDVIYTTGPDVVTEVVLAANPGEVALIPERSANCYVRHRRAGTWRGDQDVARDAGRMVGMQRTREIGPPPSGRTATAECCVSLEGPMERH